MSDDNNPAPHEWSLEEIDELLRDSGAVVLFDEEESADEALPPKAESVDPRSTRIDKTKHFVVPGAVEHSGSNQDTAVFNGLESDKYRNRFLNKPKQNIVKTAEHEPVSETGTYERSGFVKKAGSFKIGDELEPVPVLVTDDTIIAEDEAADGRTKKLRAFADTDGNAHDVELPDDEDDMQLSFEGFNEPDEVAHVDEQEVEAELDIKRRKIAEQFVITKQEETDPAEKHAEKLGVDEYRTVNDKSNVASLLKQKVGNALYSTVAMWAIFVLLAAISTASFIIQAGDKAFITAALLLMCAAGAVSHELIIDGVRSFKNFAFNRNAGAFIALCGGILQAALLYFDGTPFADGFKLYSAACVFPLALNMTAQYLEKRRIKKNFDVISENEMYSIGSIEKKETAFEIGRGLLLDEPLVLASQKTAFPRRFLELSGKYYPSDELNKKCLPISAAASFIVGLITLIISKNILCGVSAFSAVLSVSVPYSSFFADVLAITGVSDKLLKNGSVIAGWEAFRECSAANAAVADAADIYDKKGGNIYGVKTYHSMKIDEAILDTASLLIASGGPLGNLFRQVIQDKTELLSPVDTLAYEDKLGLSAWIHNRRVLVGSVQLLRNHNVEVPEKESYEKYLLSGRYPLFLAIEGKIAALFIVSYDISEQNAPYIRRIEKSGISLLVKSDDANITDKSVAKDLGVSRGGVKVMSAVSSDIYNSYRNEVTTAADALLMHDGKAETFFEAVASALLLGRTLHLSSLIQVISTGIGVVFAAILAFISATEQLTCIQLILTQLMFAVASACAVLISHKKV